MTIEELVYSMELGGFMIWCPGTDKKITIEEYIKMAEKHFSNATIEE